MICTRLALAALVVGSLVMTGCQSTNMSLPFGNNTAFQAPANGMTGQPEVFAQSPSKAGGFVHQEGGTPQTSGAVQQVSYNQPIGSGITGHGGCGCSSCQTASSGCESLGTSSCGCGSCNGGGMMHGGSACGCGTGMGCGLHSIGQGGLANAMRQRVCGCKGFSFNLFGGSNECGRCGLFRGKRCGRCGLFGLLKGRCYGCGNCFETPHTQAQGGMGPSTGTYAYPYYTVRGPRDFFSCHPSTIGR